MIYSTHLFTWMTVADAERGCSVLVSSSRGPTYVPSASPGSLCGTPAQPWIVDAEPGQHLDVAVIDFSAAEADGANGRPPSCPGHLLDSDSTGVGRRNVSLCPDGRQRERDVYRSIGHVIELITSGDQATAVKSTADQPATFIVRFDGNHCQSVLYCIKTFVRSTLCKYRCPVFEEIYHWR